MKNRNFFMLTLFTDFARFKFNFENTKRFYMARKRTFSSVFESLIETVQMIYRWKDNEIMQLFHVLCFFKIVTVFEQF
jgi:hypothetical protein